MELFYVCYMCQMCKKKGLLSIYLLFLKYVYTYCKCFDNNTHAVFGISVMFGKKCHCFIFKKKKCCIHNVHFSSCFRHNYMLFYGFGKHEKAWKLICMFGIWYQWKCQNQFTALLGLCWGPVACRWFEMTSVFSPLFTLRITQLACVTIKEDF